MLPLVFITTVVLWLFYKYWVSSYRIWTQRGIPEEPGSFPYGSDIDFSLMRKFQGLLLDKMYKKHPGSPYFGVYSMRIPFLVIRDPEIVRLILAKEFSHFRDRQGFKLPESDFLNQHLFNLEGERWKALRVKMSPTFTSGKLKGMFPLFVKCAESLDNLLFSELEHDIDIKDISARFTTDIICSCAFGLDVDSINDSENQFRRIGSNLMKISSSAKLRASLLKTFPSFFGLFQFKFTEKHIEDFLLKVVTDSVDYRKKTGAVRNDFIDLLIQLKDKGIVGEELTDNGDGNMIKPVEMTLEMMAAQCFVFFIAGFETSSSVQSYCLYELALNPEIQERLSEEIDTTIAKYGGINYQAIQEMEYLDMVVSETMRKYPTLWCLKRRCTKTFQTPAGHVIRKGDRIVIPTWSLHHDPAFFPKPESFNPERFAPGNKELIKPYSYLPFGEGPRICIGMRFGLLQTKLGIITMLRKYKVEPSEKTTIPLEFIASFDISTVNGPIMLKITKRASAF